LFIIRVKRELKRVYRNGCRYNERLNAETGRSKTSRTHSVARYLQLRNCVFVYYESMKRKLKIKPIYECRCNRNLLFIMNRWSEGWYIKPIYECLCKLVVRNWMEKGTHFFFFWKKTRIINARSKRGHEMTEKEGTMRKTWGRPVNS
jgi:hypothetical protein